ncbi:MAG: septum formation protein Maf [Bacteroidales bacterium]|nr:septum formation protein Maf [Bacteroidales bacterium]
MYEVCKYKLVLGSASPRRKELMSGAGLDFSIRLADIDESNFPQFNDPADVPVYLSKQKADALFSTLTNNELLITADTVVIIDGDIMGKPADRTEAIAMLKRLSGSTNKVVTGVTLMSKEKYESFNVSTDVHFRELSNQEIEYYVDTYKPFDKAGAYGIQEWIGYVGITGIEGSFYNVMGLPIQSIFVKLKEF